MGIGHVRNRLPQASRLFTTAKLQVPTTELSILLAIVFSCILFFSSCVKEKLLFIFVLDLRFRKYLGSIQDFVPFSINLVQKNKQKTDNSSCLSFSPLFAIIFLTTLKISMLACVFSLAMFGSKLDAWCPCQHLCCSTLQVCMIDLLGPGRVY